MLKNYKKRKQLKKLEDYYNNIINYSHSNNDYLMAHKYDLDNLEWLIAYYDDRAAATPKELLESLLNNPIYNYVSEMKKFA